MTCLARRLLLVLPLLLAGCSSDSGPSQADYPTPATDSPLGVAFDGAGGATFRVWAPVASKVDLLFFASSASGSPTATHPLAKVLPGSAGPGAKLDQGGWNGVWSVAVPVVAGGQLYQYQVGGGRALDPYAPSMGSFDSSTQAVGMAAAVDLAATRPLDPSGNAVGWAPFTAPAGYTSREGAVIYEVHVRDATIKLSGLSSPPGTYRAFAEGNVLAHVRDLGATHVQLLPVLAYYYGDESKRGTVETGLTTSGNNYNWGYDPQNYYAPDGMYSADPTDPQLRVKELMTLVNEAHKLGLGVTLDVVYNHTVNSAILDALAPGYYYRGTSASGAGPDLATERRMVRKLVVDSIVHWVRDYRVDGFRFDLMGLMDSKTIEDAYAAAAAINPSVLFVGEGWRMGSLPPSDDQGNPIVRANQDWMPQTDHAAVFSDSFRDTVKGGGMDETSDANRGFVTLAGTDRTVLLRNLRGDATNFTADTPADSVQYLTAHDGLTLHDKIGKILQLSPTSREAEILKVARLAFVLQATAQGIVFINGGCEFGRSKQVPGPMSEATSANAGPGVNLHYVYNSYDSSDAVNGFDWSRLAAGTEGARLSAHVKGLLALRRSSDAFRLGDKARAATNVTLLDGGKANAIAYRVTDVAGTTSFSVFVNAATTATALATGGDLTTAAVVVDSDEAGASPVASPSGFSGLTAKEVTIEPRTAVVFKSGP
jgi:pullulanase